jgi:hypothetical protein
MEKFLDKLHNGRQKTKGGLRSVEKPLAQNVAMVLRQRHGRFAKGRQ